MRLLEVPIMSVPCAAGAAHAQDGKAAFESWIGKTVPLDGKIGSNEVLYKTRVK